MNKLFGLLFLLIGSLFGPPAAAQEVIYSRYEKYDLRNGDFSVVGKVGGRLYTYHSTSEGHFLDAYDDSMGHLATIVLDFFPRKIYETQFIAYGDKMLVLYQSVDRGRVVQHAARLDATARLVGEPLDLDSAKTGFFGPSRSYFSFAVSDDKRRLMVYAPTVKGTELSLHGTLLNEELQVLKTVSATFTGDNDLSYGNGLVGNDGTFFLPVFTETGNQGYADQVWLLSYGPEAAGNARPVAKELPLAGLFAASTYLKMDNSHDRIYAGGFYSDKKNGNYDGVLYAWYDIPTQSFQNRKAIAFDDRMREASGERNKRRAFNDYQTRQLIVRNDGGFVLVAEDYYMTTRGSYAPYGYYSMYYSPFMMTSNIREYHYNDVMVLSYNGEGKRDWDAFIRKAQYSQEDGGMFSSYALLNSGGSLGFLFNDFNTRRSTIQLATVDGEGKVDVRSMAAGSNDDPDWLPRSGKQVAARELIVPCLRKRQICFAKIVF